MNNAKKSANPRWIFDALESRLALKAPRLPLNPNPRLAVRVTAQGNNTIVDLQDQCSRNKNRTMVIAELTCRLLIPLCPMIDAIW